MNDNPTPIEGYAYIGDQRTGAMVSPGGSIDWLCLPTFDASAVFAAMIGTPEHGRWLLGPAGEATTTRRYLPGTLVLETLHETLSGTVRVTDFMPAARDRADVIRRVEGVSGEVEMRHEWTVRPWYGKRQPWMNLLDDEHGRRLTATAGPSRYELRAPHLPGVGGDTFTVTAGEVLDFDFTWQESHLPPCRHVDVDEALKTTMRESQEWLALSDYDGDYREAFDTSLMVLRHLTDADTGGIVAAPTASLPEEIGGGRNWDYRYCWLRDASLTIEALLSAGYQNAARLWRDWLVRAVAGDPTRMQIMYRVDGGHDLPERELDHLPGYRGSTPVHIGNGAVGQRQTDVLGEVMVALEMARDMGLAEDEHTWALQVALVDHLADNWEAEDNGIWEIRGPLHKFTHSRVMVWAAMDRAIRAAQKHDLPGDTARWRAVADTVRAEVLERGWNAERGSFRQHYDTDEVDASLLLIAAVGFLEPDDERFVGTVRAVEEDLLRDGLVLRYRTGSGIDGLAGDEHPFVICCFWLASAYARVGRHDDARALMDRLVGMRNEVGLYSEEVDGQGRFYGNMPQAFSHLGLITAALDLQQYAGGPGRAADSGDRS
ncbi:glycoside hydrolase family 15 protein [Mobilicoccus caccae]|uniref:Glucoamylase n=1 Tax=Mobilicoccus caccae TaxID=1859295 RepID=A0ABQ6IWE9_9MICO|nr:glycoside hydrolase family 15 protein [Mobilicoccus caccae]GMA41608.1 glucoamylase [Mobilicoccus caccae]